MLKAIAAILVLQGIFFFMMGNQMVTILCNAGGLKNNFTYISDETLSHNPAEADFMYNTRL